MEDTLRVLEKTGSKNFDGLNPYYNGRYSPSNWKSAFQFKISMVLILIIMEDTLREQRRPCFLC